MHGVVGDKGTEGFIGAPVRAVAIVVMREKNQVRVPAVQVRTQGLAARLFIQLLIRAFP